MVHALHEIHRLLVGDGVLIDLRPQLEGSPFQVVADRQARLAGQAQELPSELENDLAADRAIAEAVQQGWFIKEQEGSFILYYYWDSPDELQEYVESEWSNYAAIPLEVWRNLRALWQGQGSRVRLDLRMLISRLKAQKIET
jgi:hypothetical protein